MTGYLIDRGDFRDISLMPDSYLRIVTSPKHVMSVPVGILGFINDVFILNKIDFIYITDSDLYSKVKDLVKNNNKLARAMWNTFKEYENEQERNNKITEITRIISGL